VSTSKNTGKKTADTTSAAIVATLQANGWVSAAEAAMRANVPKTTIHTWTSRKQLEHHVVDGESYVRLDEVKKRANAGRAAGAEPRAPREVAAQLRDELPDIVEGALRAVLPELLKHAVSEVLQERGL
jgi:hypothetical protein